MTFQLFQAVERSPTTILQLRDHGRRRLVVPLRPHSFGRCGRVDLPASVAAQALQRIEGLRSSPGADANSLLERGHLARIDYQSTGYPEPPDRKCSTDRWGEIWQTSVTAVSFKEDLKHLIRAIDRNLQPEAAASPIPRRVGGSRRWASASVLSRAPGFNLPHPCACPPTLFATHHA